MAFEIFADAFCVVYDCLGQMVENRGDLDNDTLARAVGFLNVIHSGDFLAAFVVARRCLQYLKPITVNLQKRAKDIAAAYSEISDLAACIRDLRATVDDSFSIWFAEANGMSQKVTSEDIKMPRTAGRQIHRENHQADTAGELLPKGCRHSLP